MKKKLELSMILDFLAMLIIAVIAFMIGPSAIIIAVLLELLITVDLIAAYKFYKRIK
jgi:hypothetical protein